MNARRLLAVGTWLLAGPIFAQAQAPASRPTTSSNARATQQFIETARAATSRYRDAANATADGFHRVGVAFPAMGEHWINLRLIMENRFDPALPTILIYLPTGDSLRLAGVGYTALLEAGQTEPDFAPARGFWHEHNGSVTDESLPLEHHQLRENLGDDHMRLSVLHAWVWLENPEGVFVTDNWRLPLDAASLRATKQLSQPALRAIALANHGTDYLMLILRQRAALNDADATRAAIIVSRSAHDIAKLLKPVRAGVIDSTAEAALSSRWREMWDQLAAELPAKASALRAARDG